MMLRKLVLTAAAALALPAGALLAAEGEQHIEDVAFAFEGPFGSYDQMQLQRGLQVYTEVCSGCHGLKFVPIRTLADEGGPALPEDQVRAYAEQLFVADELANPALYDEQKDAFLVTFNSNFPANTTQGAPDLSLMAKARAGFHGPYGLGINQLFRGTGGPEYIVSLLNGYTGEEKEEAGTILYENTAFPGGWVSMAPPLYDEAVVFADGHANDLEHIAEDTAAFLMWAAEPKLTARKEAGFQAVLFLTVLAALLYLTNKRLWAPVKHRSRREGE